MDGPKYIMLENFGLGIGPKVMVIFGFELKPKTRFQSQIKIETTLEDVIVKLTHPILHTDSSNGC